MNVLVSLITDINSFYHYLNYADYENQFAALNIKKKRLSLVHVV